MYNIQLIFWKYEYEYRLTSIETDRNNVLFLSALAFCDVWEMRISIGANTGVRCEARSGQCDGVFHPVQEQHLRPGERSLPRTVLLRQWLPVQLRGTENLFYTIVWIVTFDYFWQETEAYDSNNGPALMREMVSDTRTVQPTPTPGVTFSSRSQTEVRQRDKVW